MLTPAKGTPMPELDRELRVRALELAVSTHEGHEAVARATNYYAFLTGTSDRSPRETVNAALDAAGVK
jgi:hypothetical protein